MRTLETFSVVLLLLLWAPSELVPLLFFIVLFFLIYFLVGGKLLYNVVLVSAKQQHNSVIIVHISPPSSTFLPSPISLLQVITEHQAEPLVLYNNFPLVIYFTHDGAYMSMRLSQFITLSFPCCVYKSVLYFCISIPFL